MFDEGSGPPLIVVPGVQGRWEWMRPALRMLASRCRTISYSLCGDIGSGMRLDPSAGFENYVRQLDAIFERTGLARAAICGVSYGGCIAVRYAAMRPHRVSALVIASAPGPGWQPNARQERYVAHPLLSTPAFVATAPGRIWPEIRAARGGAAAALAFMARYGLAVAASPMLPWLMAERVRQHRALDVDRDCLAVTAPTLVVTGNEDLDRVVPVAGTRRYVDRIRGATHVELEDTGHIGLITAPDRFARVVTDFVHAHN